MPYWGQEAWWLRVEGDKLSQFPGGPKVSMCPATLLLY